MAFDYTNLYPDTSGNGGYTKSWNYTTVVDSMAVVGAVGYFNKVATRLGIGDNIVVAQVDAFDKTRSTLIDHTELFVISIANGVVTTVAALNLVSLVLTGIPTAPTAAPGTNSAQIATTAYADAIDALRIAADLLKANIASPTFTGTPAAPTAAPATNTTQIATTAFVEAARAILAAVKADLASPALTGTPTAPNVAVDTNTTQIANTAFVIGQAAAGTPLMDGIGAVGTLLRYARSDHVHPTDTSRAAVASPTFTGTPAAPNVTADTNTTQIANTAFVVGQATTATPLIDGVAAVGTSTRFARGDHVHPTDITKVATVKKQVFTATGTYTPSAGMLYCIIELCGGGGGGGGANSTATGGIFSGAGGGSGSYSRLLATAATIGVSKAVTIGAGGAGGTAGANNGLAGSDTSVGVLCIGKGGAGGLFGSGAQTPTGGPGGIAGTGDLVAAGTAGFPGFASPGFLTIIIPSGSGGSSHFGGGAQGVNTGASAAGAAGANYGAGGSGGMVYNAIATAAGGAGSAGVVFITEFCSQ